ncbi:hypothetical protein AB1K54_15855 [Microbacterium sp. BWT-B31]|uniref:hypothetical protein n=1 Tax=Microbacterium sp. BWT-B31 TaxID=3232072 RepID=UPI003528AB93
MPSDEPMLTLARRLNGTLRARFGRAVSGFTIRERREGEHAVLQASFALYEYWIISFGYDRGMFGFGVPLGDTFVPVLDPDSGQSIDDLDRILDELDRKVRLRIPDKYLEAWDSQQS